MLDSSVASPVPPNALLMQVIPLCKQMHPQHLMSAQASGLLTERCYH